MDAIKFRVFYEEKLIPCSVGFKGEVYVLNNAGSEYIEIGCVGNKERFLNSLYVMQYTCLVDKNNKPIYEGDIVRLRLERKNVEGPVVYRTGDYVVEVDDDFYFLMSPEDMEIVGNIYIYGDKKDTIVDSDFNDEEVESVFYNINVICSEEAGGVLMKVLEKLQELGFNGATREIIIDDDTETLREYFDGDGNAFIKNFGCRKLSTEDKKVIENKEDKKRWLTIASNAIEKSLKILEKED